MHCALLAQGRGRLNADRPNFSTILRDSCQVAWSFIRLFANRRRSHAKSSLGG